MTLGEQLVQGRCDDAKSDAKSIVQDAGDDEIRPSGRQPGCGASRAQYAPRNTVTTVRTMISISNQIDQLSI